MCSDGLWNAYYKKSLFGKPLLKSLSHGAFPDIPQALQRKWLTKEHIQYVNCQATTNVNIFLSSLSIYLFLFFRINICSNRDGFIQKCKLTFVNAFIVLQSDLLLKPSYWIVIDVDVQHLFFCRNHFYHTDANSYGLDSLAGFVFCWWNFSLSQRHHWGGVETLLALSSIRS